MDSDQDKPDSGIPEWQRGADDDAASNAVDKPAEDQLQVARRFLEDDEVKGASREKKVAFLKAKGIEDGDIEKLLGEAISQDPVPDKTEEASPTTSSTPPTPSTEKSPPDTPSTPSFDRAPIVTYPEFLANPSTTSPPPLVTTGRLFATLQVTAALSTLLVGASKFILTPMLERQTESREDLHATTAARLDSIVALLEKSVSAVPPPPPPNRGSRKLAGDEDSDVDDPSEMFHRDVGTQTFLPVVPSASAAPKTPPAEAQASRLESLARSLTDVKDGLRSQSDGLSDVKMLIDVFGDDLDALTYRSPGELPGYDLFRGKKAEPEDEMRKVRDSIRRIKGALLSTRSFPTSSR